MASFWHIKQSEKCVKLEGNWLTVRIQVERLMLPQEAILHSHSSTPFGQLCFYNHHFFTHISRKVLHNTLDRGQIEKKILNLKLTPIWGDLVGGKWSLLVLDRALLHWAQACVNCHLLSVQSFQRGSFCCENECSTVIRRPTQTMQHYYKGNPSKLPCICNVWSPSICNI